MKLIRGSFLIVPVLFAGIPIANAQTSFDLNVGFGTARNSSNGGGIDNFSGLSCTPSPASTTCAANPSLGGFFMGLGGALIFQKHLGFGAEVNFQPAKSDYGPLQYRQTFYDFNGILAPINEKKVQVQIQGGIGGTKTGFSITQNQCVGPACSSFTQPFASTSHFQVHVGVGVELYLTEHVFIRPEFDFHYVPNFTDEFGRNTVPQGMIWIGYSLGGRT